MTLDDVASIAEIVSAIAVVATLAYLTVQIRQSSAISRANIRQQLASQQIDYLTQRVSLPAIASARAKEQLNEPLTEIEAEALGVHAHVGLRLFESCHAPWEYGTLPDDDWNAIRRRYELALRTTPAYRENFESFPDDIWNPRFAALVRSIIRKGDAE